MEEKVSKTQYDRTKLLLEIRLKYFKKSSVIIFGVGGVGGYVTEMLARAGYSKYNSC
jgi:tRNA A37 threonylcarbamoyladenosine dehydratase